MIKAAYFQWEVSSFFAKKRLTKEGVKHIITL